MDRARRRADADRAYNAQVQAGTIGAVRATGVGVGLAIIAHYSWPWFRRQTLAFKGFLVTGFAVFGLVTHAERALQTLEAEQRKVEGALRREARLALARKGLVATETQIEKWKAERLSR
ncbi:hypothetical protein BXZ70DRAFT_918603 [Cristinia sonorae]|uniref:Uncharacterized protein n=1 Tax=Cristinia sonorae TaxID=1940300 RepID=A0A8K0UYL0_9AGAR|nr:hypothetical protein BXZ70DRAFT_918603 [Cristinia sonorae]